jgi:hypothetical protein
MNWMIFQILSVNNAAVLMVVGYLSYLPKVWKSLERANSII